jgi:anti-sigma regulatory factor (Ser/Thr protein kinase)/anti-anti-sigma regulatory factor
MNLHNNNNDVSLVLPETVGVKHIVPLMAALNQVRASPGNVELDCSKVRFVDPLGITALAAAVKEALAQGRRVAMPWLAPATTSYLERMNFFVDMDIDAVDVPKNRIRTDQRGNLLEITHIVDSGKSEAAADQLASAIVNMIIGRSEKAADAQTADTEYRQYYKPLRYALSELIENALTHARREGAFNSSVWVAAQYYKDAQTGGRVQVAVVDNGCGFLATLQNHPALQENTHGAAIRIALKPKVSCNRDMGPFGESVNEGVGLTTTVLIAKATGGDVHIVSGDTMLLEGGVAGAKRRDQVRALQGQWNGVAISATFVCQKLPFVNIAELLPPVGPAKQAKPLVTLRFDD